MSTRQITIAGVIGLVVLALTGGVWLGRGPLQGHPNEQAEAAPSAAASSETGVVPIDAKAQVRSGIATAPLKSFAYGPEVSAYAVVVDIQPLLTLRARHAAATAELQSAEASARASRQELERSRVLFSDDRNVSLKALQAAETAYRADQAKVDSTSSTLREVNAIAVQQFGETLARWAFDPESREFAPFLARRQVLVRVATSGDVAVSTPQEIVLDAPGYARSTASYVSPSPQADLSVQTRPLFYRTNVAYPSGLRLKARMPISAKKVEGVLIPESAVVWYGNEAWAYVQQSEERFTRRLVKGGGRTEGGFFVAEGFKPGERVVVTGAQLLNAEELRPKASSASGCKDPECD